SSRAAAMAARSPAVSCSFLRASSARTLAFSSMAARAFWASSRRLEYLESSRCAIVCSLAFQDTQIGGCLGVLGFVGRVHQDHTRREAFRLGLVHAGIGDDDHQIALLRQPRGGAVDADESR